MKIYQIEEDWQDSISIFTCRRKKLPSHNISRKFSGKYKGIPWEVVIKNANYEEIKQIFFYSKIYTHILVKRIVYVPYLKHKCIANGNFVLPCSAFSFENTIFLLLNTIDILK